MAHGEEAPEQRAPGWLGLGVTWRTSDESVFLHVERLFPNGPAMKAGIKLFDVVTGINGRSIPFEREIEMLEFMRGLRVGDKATLWVVRGEDHVAIEISAEALPPEVRREVEKGRQHARDKAREPRRE